MLFNLAYLVALVLFSPAILYAALKKKKYRDGWGQKFLGLVPVMDAPKKGVKRVWFHAVSVGEVNLLKPLVAELRATRPQWEFVVSSVSKTGYELAKSLFGSQTSVFYCPFDFTWAVKRAVKRVKPDALALVELELWPNLIRAAKTSGAAVVVVNGRIGADSFKNYRRVKRFLAPTFRRIDLAIAQDELAADRFRQISSVPERVVVSGSVKFDGVSVDRDNPESRRLAQLAGFQDDDVVFIAGSTHAPEEEGALEVYRRLRGEFPKLRLVLVPRSQDRFDEVAKLLDASEFQWARRSALDATDARKSDARVLLVDVIGELSKWWATADVAFVGGSWSKRGGQNMLEPAGFGAAVSFGPNTKNFRSIVESMLDAGAAVVVADPNELEAFVRRCLLEPEYRAQLGAAAQRLVLANRGAARRTVEMLASVLEP